MIEKVEMYKTEDGSLFEYLMEAELYQRKLQSNSDFLERLSSIIWDKQMLFKQEKGRYYSKYHGCELEVDEAEEWLLGELRGEK